LRSKWGIAEVGIDYELVRANFMTDAKSAGYRAINPSGRFPALIDGELTLFRAMAINV
jgi:glutathione S-transferase